ncbi:uncharacterized protein AMSG_01754 [Thecamonas trahens ATCC 50062]|uniref:Disease resistance R13L4/SHOC-2-like LRR domain-containing protein n=1 Tax=Thecamonas trahens ATCC 50062 TaxID=461836 RepID=A0A0L0DT95_THETB|nr:hypothetical protein AMSG_01754 [Thecamonas trahens ATCC 50062]KNC55490.1 hypothetical protein AMSG_01754 [Thecamonas trahens ATCC 50062]|eukprot:XP_013761270.1 hypothetical protein AMSG_01754 [Thecamonas trahens ATCC 50062]
MPLFGSGREKTPRRLVERIKAARASHKLSLSDERLDELPREVFKSGLPLLSKIPTSLGKLTALTILDLSRNDIKVLPDVFAPMDALTRLNVSSNALTALPDSIGKLGKLNFFNASENSLASLPSSISGLTSLKELELTRNALAALPPAIAKLTSLRLLDLGHNELVELPACIGALVSLKDLSVKHNKLTALPLELGKLRDLRILNVNSNELDELPPELAKLRGTLAIIDFQGNPLAAMPPHIRTMPTTGLLHYLDNPDSDLLVVPGTLLSPTNRIVGQPSQASDGPLETIATVHRDGSTDPDATRFFDNLSNFHLPANCRASSSSSRSRSSSPEYEYEYAELEPEHALALAADADADADESGDSLVSGDSTPRTPPPELASRADVLFSVESELDNVRPLVLESGQDPPDHVVVSAGAAGGIDRAETLSRISAAFEAARVTPDIGLDVGINPGPAPPTMATSVTAAAEPRVPRPSAFGPRQSILRAPLASRPLRGSNTLLSSTLRSPGGRRGIQSAVLPRETPDFLPSFGTGALVFPTRGSSPPPRASPLSRATPAGAAPPAASSPARQPQLLSASLGARPEYGQRLSMAIEPQVTEFFASGRHHTPATADTLRSTNAFLRSAPSSAAGLSKTASARAPAPSAGRWSRPSPATATAAPSPLSRRPTRADSYLARYHELTRSLS